MGYYNSGYWATEANRGRWIVTKDGETIGQVRIGLDNRWYPELLPGEGFRSAAIQRLILAHEAMEEFRQAVGGGHGDAVNG